MVCACLSFVELEAGTMKTSLGPCGTHVHEGLRRNLLD